MPRTVEVLTGSGTWVVPANVTKLEAVVLIGGGGGGCSTAIVGEDNCGGGGGGSSVYLDAPLTASDIASGCAYEVGQGGGPDINGGNSSFISENIGGLATGGGEGANAVEGLGGFGDSFSGGDGSPAGDGDVGAGGGGGAGSCGSGQAGSDTNFGSGSDDSSCLTGSFPELTTEVLGGNGGDGGVLAANGSNGSNFGGGGGGAGTGGVAGGAGGDGTIVLIYTPLPIHTGDIVITAEQGFIVGESIGASDEGSWDEGDFDSWVFEAADNDLGANNTGNIGDNSDIFTLGEPQLGKYIRAGMVQTNSGGQQTAYSAWYGPIEAAALGVSGSGTAVNLSNPDSVIRHYRKRRRPPNDPKFYISR
jgi:hypothetical protein